MDERRSSKRIPVTFRAQFTPLFSGAGEGTITNLTLQGCRMETHLIVPVHTYLELRLHMSLTDSPLVVDLAAVRWVRGRQLGIEFLTFQSSHQIRLEQSIEADLEGAT